MDREPRAKCQEPRHYRTIEHAPTSCLWCCLDTVGVGWICLDRGPTAGVTVPNRYGSAAIGASGSPNPRAPRLGPRAFSISLVNSFGGNFVFHFQLRKQTWPSLNTDGWCADEVAFRCMRTNGDFLNLVSPNRGQTILAATIA